MVIGFAMLLCFALVWFSIHNYHRPLKAIESSVAVLDVNFIIAVESGAVSDDVWSELVVVSVVSSAVVSVEVVVTTRFSIKKFYKYQTKNSQLSSLSK